MSVEENKSLREEIERLKRKNDEAITEAQSYKAKYEVIVKKVDDEIKLRVENAKEQSISSKNDSTSKPADIETLSSLRQEAVSASDGLHDLQRRWSYLDFNLNNCLYRLNRIEQYMRINSLLFHGFPLIPNDKEHGRALKQFLLDKLNELFPDLEGGPVKADQIEFGHTLRTRKSVKHVVIIKFSCRFTRNAIFYAKSKLPKMCGVSISEHLTHENLQLLNEAKKLVGDRNAWSSQTKIFAKVNGAKWSIWCLNDIDKLKYAISKQPFRRDFPHNSPNDNALRSPKVQEAWASTPSNQMPFTNTVENEDLATGSPQSPIG